MIGFAGGFRLRNFFIHLQSIMVQMLLSILLGVISLYTPTAQHDDNVLNEAVLTAEKGLVVSRKDTLSTDGILGVTDLLLMSPSLQPNDYGGVSGLKSVSLRGFGSAHTSIYVDGIRVTNVQSGQSDLGFLPLASFDYAVVDYAQNSISFRTSRPVFENKPFIGTVKLDAGSFSTYSPLVYAALKLSDNFSISTHINALYTKGNYPYEADLFRENNDMKRFDADIDLFGNYNGYDLHIKTFLNASKRGTPGSLVYPSKDRQNDQNYFIQGTLSKKLTELYTLHFSTKEAVDNLEYISEWGNSYYSQNNLQFNLVNDIQLADVFNVTVATDAHLDNLSGSVYNVSRTEFFSSVAGAYRSDLLSAEVVLEYNATTDKGGVKTKAILPSADIRLRLYDGLFVTAFARRAFRAPTFNDLYYPGFGNTSLKPEDAFLADMGLEYICTPDYNVKVKAQLDGFYNLLTNKITSAPTEENPSVWRSYNIGKVHSSGFDATMALECSSDLGIEWTLNAKYSFLNAIDRTPNSSNFGKQIPFIAKHSAFLEGKLRYDGWMVLANWQGRFGRTQSASMAAADWNTLDLTLGKSIRNLAVKLSARNVFDYRYQLADGYPMPGFNFVAGIEYKF